MRFRLDGIEFLPKQVGKLLDFDVGPHREGFDQRLDCGLGGTIGLRSNVLVSESINAIDSQKTSSFMARA